MLSCLPLAFALLGGASDETPLLCESFRLPSADGAYVDHPEPDVERMGTAMAFVSSRDEESEFTLELFSELADAYLEEGFRFLVVHCDRAVGAKQIASWAAGLEMDGSVAVDDMQGLADRLGVTRFGTVVLLGPDGLVEYRGAVEGDESYLLDALEAVLMGSEVPVPRSESAGAAFAPLAEQADAVQFHRDVAPVLHRHCVECHREGQIGPMSLLDVEEARGWAPMIAEVVGDGRMPPWNANPAHGRYHNERRLTETEKAVLAVWADTGAAEGDVADAPPTPTFTDSEWRIGTPDDIYELPEDEHIPATGVVPYRYVVVDPELKQDRWVEAVEIRHTAPEVTHHILVYMLPPNETARQFLRGTGQLGEALLAGIAPGNPPDVYDEGTARRIPAGTRFLFQLHYTPNGVPAVDRSQMAIRWADPATVTHESLAQGIVNLRIDIKPYQDDQVFHAEYRSRGALKVVGLSPHMHARGKSFRYDLVRADGTTKTLLDVPEYDFNWQHNYLFDEPLQLAKGDKVLLTGVYDNSVDNPSNPDPSDRVRWGDQTFEEMFLGWIFYERPAAGAETPR